MEVNSYRVLQVCVHYTTKGTQSKNCMTPTLGIEALLFRNARQLPRSGYVKLETEMYDGRLEEL
jgi:hypothetical protein